MWRHLFHLRQFVHTCINKPPSKNQDKKREWWKKERWRHSSLAQGQGWGVSSIYTKKSERSLKSPTLLKIEVAFVLKASSLCKCQSITRGKLDLFSLQSFSHSPISFAISLSCDFEHILKLFPSFIQHKVLSCFFLVKILSFTFLPGNVVQDLIWP